MTEEQKTHYLRIVAECARDGYRLLEPYEQRLFWANSLQRVRSDVEMLLVGKIDAGAWGPCDGDYSLCHFHRTKRPDGFDWRLSDTAPFA